MPLSFTLDPMLSTSRLPPILAAVGAAALAAFEFDLALSGAGPYQSAQNVQSATFIGIGLGYFIVLCLSAYAARFANSIARRQPRIIGLAIVAIVAAFATLMSPLLPALMLAVGCKTELACPQIANPVLWSYLKSVTELPLSPMLVGMLVVGVAAFSTHKGGTNGV